MAATIRRAGLYARVSTTDQTCENQLGPLRAFAEARGWHAQEYVDVGISGMKDRRPGLDGLLQAVRARKVDVVVVVKLDRLARSLRHLVTMSADFEALGVDLVALDQTIDTTTPSGKLMFGILAAISEFERDLIVDRVKAGMARARAQGKHVGRPTISGRRELAVRRELAKGTSVRKVARQLGVGVSTVLRVQRSAS